MKVVLSILAATVGSSSAVLPLHLLGSQQRHRRTSNTGSKGSNGGDTGNCILETVISIASTFTTAGSVEGLERWGVDDVFTFHDGNKTVVGTTSGYCVRSVGNNVANCVQEYTFEEGTLLFGWQDFNNRGSRGVVVGATGCYEDTLGFTFPFSNRLVPDNVNWDDGLNRNRGLVPCESDGTRAVDGAEGERRAFGCKIVMEADLSALR